MTQDRERAPLTPPVPEHKAGIHDGDVTQGKAPNLLHSRPTRLGSPRLELNFSRSMESGLNTKSANSAEPPMATSARPLARRGFALIVLAAALAIVGALAAGYYFAVRPVTLRIA